MQRLLALVNTTTHTVCFSSLPSLSELREYTEGLSESTEANDCEHCTSQPGQSVISLLSTEELKKLIEEVKVLDEATLKVGFFFMGIYRDEGLPRWHEW